MYFAGIDKPKIIDEILKADFEAGELVALNDADIYFHAERAGCAIELSRFSRFDQGPLFDSIRTAVNVERFKRDSCKQENTRRQKTKDENFAYLDQLLELGKVAEARGLLERMKKTV